MPSLDDLLARSMAFTAAQGRSVPMVPLSSAFRTPAPKPQTADDMGGHIDEETVLRNPIWRFSWDPAKPATFEQITIASRGMGMDYGMSPTVFEQIEFRGLQVTRPAGDKVDLFLDPDHMLGAWWTRVGEIGASASGLWQLETFIDSSIIVAFGYVLDCDKPRPLLQEEIDQLGESLIPATDLGPPMLDFIAGEHTSAWACVGPVRYIAIVELVLCKERPDFVPGELIGFARIHPHLLFWANEDTKLVEASIVMVRPAKAMSHDDAMGTEHKALVVSDTNCSHDPTATMGLPLPTTDRLYDYYEIEPAVRFKRRTPTQHDHPLQKTGEVTLADARFKRDRVIADAIKRNSPLVSSDPDCAKEARQGQFDNVHIAPRMKLVLRAPDGTSTQIDDVPMLNMCLHDCTHMHVRWSSFLTDKILKGWKHGRPYAESGAPMVPENQTVFVSFPNQHTLRYRSVSKSDEAGHLVIVCHHGLAYAIDEWPTKKAKAMIALLLESIHRLAREFEEPWWNGDANDKWAEFYWRIRYTGKARFPILRSEFDLEECMR